ncbi:MAG: hypothetical protein RI948_976 [Bacteroidota bacterium]|jgi:hypothetical protein
MRLYHLFLVSICFVLLAFAYWPSEPTNLLVHAKTQDSAALPIPPTDPYLFTSKLNNRLVEYMDRSVKQGIQPVANTQGLRKAFRAKKLVLIEPKQGFVLDTFEYSYAFLTPYAAKILEEIGSAFQDSLAQSPLQGCQLIVTSMTRTKHTVAKLVRKNRTAVKRSPHLNGNSFDISFSRFKASKSLSTVEKQYLQTVIAQILVRFKKDIKIWATFEVHEECLHVVARKGV